MTSSKIFQVALSTARTSRTSAAYREAAKWAGNAASDASYGERESFWAQQDELAAMANDLAGKGL